MADANHPMFLMPIDDVFALKANKVVVVGVVGQGVARPKDSLVVMTQIGETPVKVEALEAHHKRIQYAQAEDRVGIILVGINKEDIVLPAILVSK